MYLITFPPAKADVPEHLVPSKDLRHIDIDEQVAKLETDFKKGFHRDFHGKLCGNC
jgi:hypothetical protein